MTAPRWERWDTVRLTVTHERFEVVVHAARAQGEAMWCVRATAYGRNSDVLGTRDTSTPGDLAAVEGVMDAAAAHLARRVET